MAGSVFTKIINSELPCHKVYEDVATIAIMPLHPISDGRHVLVIPKVEVDQFVDLDDKDYQALMTAVKKVGQRMRQVLKPKRIGMMVVGTDVPHVHIHVIGFDTVQQFREVADESQPSDHQKLAEMAAKLAF
jgi:histidine triad (HIT) family protein